MNNKIRKRLDKLLALTESNNKHEADNALSRIKTLCSKHGIDYQQLIDESEIKESFWFRYDNSNSEQVLVNAIWKICGNVQIYKNRYKQRQLCVDITKGEAAELELYWSIMRAAFKQHLKDATNAFIMANNIYGESEDEEGSSDVDWDAVERQMRMAENINPTQCNKAITDES